MRVPKNRQIPHTLYLIDVRERTAHEAHVAWSKGVEVGLSFHTTLPLTGIKDPALAFLKQLWMQRALG